MKTISGLQGISDYLAGVEARLIHHGAHLRPLVGTLTTGLLAKIDPTATLRVRTMCGKLTNQVRLTLQSGRQIKVTYSARRGFILVQDDATGQELGRFNMNTNLHSVGKAIASW